MFPTLLRRARPLLPALALLTLAPLALPTRAAVKDPDQAKTAADATEALQQTPEGALRAFLASMLGPDPATLRQVILPVSDADFALLLASHPLPTEVRQIEVSRIASMPLRSLKPGDTVTLPNKRTLTISKSDVGRDTALIQMSSNPLPVLVHRVKGLWYVDAAPIIAARRTAAELRRQMPRHPAAPPAKHAPAKGKRVGREAPPGTNHPGGLSDRHSINGG